MVSAADQFPAEDCQRHQQKECRQAEYLEQPVADKSSDPARAVVRVLFIRSGVGARIPRVEGDQTDEEQDGEREEQDPEDLVPFSSGIFVHVRCVQRMEPQISRMTGTIIGLVPVRFRKNFFKPARTISVRTRESILSSWLHSSSVLRITCRASAIRAAPPSS